MDDAINNLYMAFAAYRIGDDFDGCDCCVDPKHSVTLTSRPLRELTFGDLERYASKAMTTWGNVRHFKHFLPRILELSIEHRDDFLDLAVVFGKLAYANFDAWPQREKEAVNQFFAEYWDRQLAEPIVGAIEDAIDTVLCAISNALPSVQLLLKKWINTPTDNAKRHLATFILNNAASLQKRSRLSNAFWDPSGEPHREVVYWLLSDEVLDFLSTAEDLVLADDFSYAHPQLLAIRASIPNPAV
jgi:hypothetical protein